MDLKLEGKRALISGSNGGIGESIAAMLAREGAEVVIHGRDRSRAESVASRIREAGGAAFVAVGDLATDDGAKSTIEAALEQLGSIDILVNNAGGNESTTTGWFDFSIDEWETAFRGNTLSAVRLIQALVPPMRDRSWGRVINIGSAGGVQPEPYVAHYCGAKATINNLTVSLSKALPQSGVTVNTVSPGVIRTPALEDWLVNEARSRGWPGSSFEDFEPRYLEEMRPLSVGRIGRVEDVGALVAFLASPVADFITGANFRVDGGQVLTVN